MFSGHSSPLLHLCHLLGTSCLEVCVSYKTSSIVIQLVEYHKDGKLREQDSLSRETIKHSKAAIVVVRDM